jgi:C-terminal processing protease CtpA/Prc
MNPLLNHLNSTRHNLLKTHHSLGSICLATFTAMLILTVTVHGQVPSPTPSNPHQVYPSDSSLPRGIIGVAIHLSAHRVGDPARLYIRAIHPEGPAAKVDLEHGDEILAVDGNLLNGKTYEQIIRMIRGDIGQTVKLQVNGAPGNREVTIPRVSEDTLMGKKRT